MSQHTTAETTDNVMINEPERDHGPYRIGANYMIRTVTNYYTGKLAAVFPQELVLVDAAWIADTGRFSNAVACGQLDEIEPYPDGRRVVVGRGAIVDAVEITWPLPRTQK